MEKIDRKQRELKNATLPELLLYGLALEVEDDPVLGMLVSVQQELKLIATLLISSPPVIEMADVELSSTLELFSRRLEVACEYMRRAKQGSDIATEPSTGAATDPTLNVADLSEKT